MRVTSDVTRESVFWVPGDCGFGSVNYVLVSPSAVWGICRNRQIAAPTSFRPPSHRELTRALALVDVYI